MRTLRAIFTSPWWFGSWAVIYAAIDAASWIGFPTLENEHSRVVWLLSFQAIFLIAVIASFVSLHQEKAGLERQLKETSKLKLIPNSFKCDERKLYMRNEKGQTVTETPIRSLVVQFMNEPKFHAESANAHDVIAKAMFYSIDAEGAPKLILEDYPRWATNDDLEPAKANKHLLPTDIRIGEPVELDLAVKYLHEFDTYAVTNQSYVSHALRHPHPLHGKRFLVVVSLSAVNVRESFEFTFENQGKDKPLVALTMRQVPTAVP